MPYKDPEVAKAKRKAKYEATKTEGICVQCKQPWTGKQKKCDCCRQKDKENKAKRKAQWEAAGLCNRCGKHPAMEGVRYCEECYQKSKKHSDSEETKVKRLEKYHKVYKPRITARRVARKAAGLCADCGKMAAIKGVLCQVWYDKRREIYERNYLTYDERLDIKMRDRDAIAEQRNYTADERVDFRELIKVLSDKAMVNAFNSALATINHLEYKQEVEELELTTREHSILTKAYKDYETYKPLAEKLAGRAVGRV